MQFELQERRSNWSYEAIDKFIELTGVDQELTALISSDFDENETLSVVMLMDGDVEKCSVNEMMVLLRYASSPVFKAGVNLFLKFYKLFVVHSSQLY